jgi:hypothetical protein
MALEKGVNSYVTVAEAELYFENRLDSDAWISATLKQQQQALTTATELIDGMTWLGQTLTVSQALAFPRTGTYFDPRSGTEVSLGTVPTRIIVATFLLALHLVGNPGILSASGSVKDLKLDSINLVNIKAVEKIPSTITRLLKPILLNGGQNAWWRAN